jgi:biotin carboxyl carrier protein
MNSTRSSLLATAISEITINGKVCRPQDVTFTNVDDAFPRVSFVLGNQKFCFELNQITGPKVILLDVLKSTQSEFGVESTVSSEGSSEKRIVFSDKDATFSYPEVNSGTSSTRGANPSKNKSSIGNLNVLTSPMPGKVFKLLFKVGDKVEAGQVVMVLEAMKMEHALKAPCSGIIQELPFAVGDQVKAKAVVLRIRD